MKAQRAELMDDAITAPRCDNVLFATMPLFRQVRLLVVCVTFGDRFPFVKAEREKKAR